MDPIYVFGHRNPDTDAICSAIAYAYFKNRLAPGHIPVRLGNLNAETRFVLDTWDIEEPEFLPHLHLRVQDVMSRDIKSAPINATVYEVGELMRQAEVQAIPLVDASGRAQGVVTERSLARAYLRELQVQSLDHQPTELRKIAQTLNGSLVVGRGDTQVSGDVVIATLNVTSMGSFVRKGDLVILGNRENAQEAALDCDPSCLILTRDFPPSEAIKKRAREQGVGIIITPHPTFMTARLINLSVDAMRLADPAVLRFSPDSLVSEITSDLLAAKTGAAMVENEEGYLLGVITKGDIVARRRRRAILVDHSEKSQSVEGIETADILEIVDHHRLGGLETANPMFAMIAPVGSTCTLVLRRYREAGITVPRNIAGVMVSAILSDTMLLKSPTTTPEDVAAIAYLGEIIGEDPLAYGGRMYNAKFDIANLAPEALATSDLKTFVFGTHDVGIAQVEVGDKEAVLEHKEELLEAMKTVCEKQGFDLMLLMVTDLFREGTELLTVGNTRAVERAFNATLTDNALWLPGVLSRKKQVVPPMANAF
jgi:manganese-dependent inorganic pyrophosphatase